MSTTVEFKKIHAFADTNYHGNPAGYVFNDIGLNTTQMQQIATEMRNFVSEVVYVKQGSNGCDFDFRYFSCECEVPFCGHGTLAAINYLISQTPELNEKRIIKINTTKGVIDVENDFTQSGATFVHAPEKEYTEFTVNYIDLAQALNLEIKSIDTTKPVQIYNAGQNTLIVPLISASEVINCLPSYDTLRDYCFNNNCAIVNIFSCDTTQNNSDYRTRIFAPTFGYLEDLATGSGNSALGYYLEDNNIWDGRNLTIEQGNSIENPNIVYIRKPEKHKNRVMFGGKSLLKLDGKFYL